MPAACACTSAGGPQVEGERHRLAVVLAEQRLDVRREADRLVRPRQGHGRVLLGRDRHGGRRARGTPVPGGRRCAGGPRAPLQVGDEGRTERRVGRQAGLAGGLNGQGHPAGALLLGHVRPGRCLRGRGAAEGGGDHGGLALRAIRGHAGEQRGEQVVGWHVLLVQQPGHPGQRGQATGPLEQGRRVRTGPGRVAEVHVPVHAAAERLVLRVAAAAQRVVLAGRARGPGHVRAVRVGHRDRPGDPVRAVLGHLDGALPGPVPVGQVARLPISWPSKPRLSAPDGQSRTARTSSSRRPPLGATKGSAPVRNAVGTRSRAQPGVLADAPVVEDRDLLPGVGVALVGHPVRVLGVGETAGRVRPVAEGLDRRGAAPAQRELRRHRELLAQRGAQHGDVGDQVGAVLGGHDRGRQLALELAELGDALLALADAGR